MKYKAKIEYVDNVQKAGKLTLTNEEGKVLLSKVPVAMPDEIFTTPKLFEKIHSTRSVQIKIDENLKLLDKNGLYQDSYKEIIQNNSEGFFIKSLGKVLVKPTNETKMKNDDHAFVMHKEHFQVLFDILSNKQLLEIESKKVSFLWFPEKVSYLSSSVNLSLASFEKLESKIRNEKEDVDRIIALEVAQKKAKVNVGITKPKLSEAINNIAKIVNNEDKKYNQNVVKSVKNQSIIQALPVAKNTNKKENSNLDPLDIVLMYSNPELAPFMNPNSSLAWYLYFNNKNNNINKNYVEENLQNVQGFENVVSSEFKYTPKGYSVTLFDDSNKSNQVGKIDFDNQNNFYEVISKEGEKTLLSIKDNGQLESFFKSSSGNETQINLIQKDKGFVGNWESNNNGVKVNSAIEVHSDFSYNSTPNAFIDISMNKGSTLGANSINPSSLIDKDYTPPPPPPPKSNETWGSNDPYSNASSFRM